MAKFNEYPSKATPEDADTLMLYDAASKSNKLSPFSGIWNWMVGKLTNAVIANLQTNNKTVLGAINELNSNRLAFININTQTTINNKTVEVKFDSIEDTQFGIIVINGWIKDGVFFTALVSYGTKWSVDLISFNASNTDMDTVIVNGQNKTIQFTVTIDMPTVLYISAKLIN